MELLNNLIQLISVVITNEFVDELKKAKSSLEMNIAPYRGFTKKDGWDVIDNLVAIINKELIEKDKDYQINI